MRFISRPENMAIIEALVERLEDLPVGGTLPKKDIENLVKGKVHLLYKARRMVEAEHGCAFGAVIGQGLKKLSGDTIHALGENSRKKAVKGLKRSEKTIVGVLKGDSTPLSRQDKLKCNAELAKIGLAAQFLVDK